MTSVRSCPLIALAFFAFSFLPVCCLADDGRWSEDFHLGGTLHRSAMAAVVFEEQLVLGGTFTIGQGTTLYHVVRWTGAAWEPVGSGPAPSCYALIVHAGQLWAGGYRLDGDTWTDVLQTDGTVYALADFAGDLYAGGDFTSAAGESAAHLVRWDGAAVAAVGAGTDGGVRALAVHEGRLYIGGHFSSAGGVAVTNLAAFDGASWYEVGGGVAGIQEYCCNQYGQPYHFPAWVKALASYGGRLIVGGQFAAAAGETLGALVAWDGMDWQAVGQGVREWGMVIESMDDFYGYPPCVNALLVDEGNLLAGGRFVEAGGESCFAAALWDGAVWHGLGGGLGPVDEGPSVYAIASCDGVPCFAGSFRKAGGRWLNTVASWDGTRWHPMPGDEGLGLGAQIYAQTLHEGKLIIGGIFDLAGEVPASVAAFDGSAWLALGDGPFGGAWPRVRALASFEGDLIAGGHITEVAGQPANNVVRWDGASWQPMGEGIDCFEILALAVHDGQLYAAANPLTFPYDLPAGCEETEESALMSAAAAGRQEGALLRWSGVDWQQIAVVTGGLFGTLYALASYQGDLVLGGDFEEIDGEPFRRVCRWDGSTFQALGGGVDGIGVRCLAVQGDDLIVGGGFDQAGEVDAHHIARWDGMTWSALGDGLYGGGGYYGAWDLQVCGDQIFVGGRFDGAGGVASRGIAMWTGSSWRGFAGGVDEGLMSDGYVYAVSLLDGDLYVGGDFELAGGTLSNNLARWSQTNLPVYLSFADARREGSRARVCWEIGGTGGTATEVSFHIWRGTLDEPRQRISSEPVAEGAIAGRFEFVDPEPPAGGTSYWLEQVGAESRWLGPIALDAATLPARLRLASAVPNPFNPATMLSFTLPAAGPVRVTVHDLQGRRVATLLDGPRPAGPQQIRWNGRDDAGRPLPAGTYLARLVWAGGTAATKLSLVK